MKRVLPLLLYLISGCGGGAAASPGGRDYSVPAPESPRSASLSPNLRVHVSLKPSSRPPLVLGVGEMGRIDDRYAYRYPKSAMADLYSGMDAVELQEGTLALGLLLGVEEIRVEDGGLTLDVLLEWTSMPGQPRYFSVPNPSGGSLCLEAPVTLTSSIAATVHLREPGRHEEIVVPSPVPGDRRTAAARLSLGGPARRGRMLRLALEDTEGEKKAFGIPRASGSFGVTWQSTRSFLSDYDVELGQSALFLETVLGSVTEGTATAYREGYGGFWVHSLPVDLVEFHSGLGLLERPVTIEFHDEQAVRRGTVRIAGDTVFLDPAAASK